MGGYNRHIIVGWFCHFTLSSFTFFLLAIEGYSTTSIITIISLSLPITLIASVIPDIDHHNSIPNKIAKYIIFISVLMSVGFILSSNADQIIVDTPINKPIFVFLTVIISLVVSSLSVGVFNRHRPKHRGLTHQISTSLILSGILFVIVWYISSGFLVSVVLSVFCISGYMSHLLIDRCTIFTN